MTNEPLIEQVYRQAFVDTLFAHASRVLCPQCSTVMESSALNRYKMMMARRREEIDSLRTKIEKEKQIEDRREELGGEHEK